MRIITFMSDFGIKDSYVAQMKAVASSMTDARLIDITHEIKQHNIRQGAFILQSSAPYFPPGTVHVAVVDPGVGTNRRGIVITTHSQILIGPDNGLLLPTAKSLGDFIVYSIENPKLLLDSISNTFHGRDVFTPIACRIVNGLPFEEIGPIITDFVEMDFGKVEITDKSANGKIMYTDHFGNIITNIDWSRLKQHLDFGKKIMVFIGKKQKQIQFVKSYNFVKKGGLLATIGSSNNLEISMNQGDAAKKLRVKADDDIKILFS